MEEVEPHQYAVLLVVAQEPRKTEGAIASSLNLSISQTGRTLKELAAAGWLLLRKDSQDKRHVQVELTEAGRKKVAQCKYRERRAVELLVSSRDGERGKRALEVFKDLNKQAREIGEDAADFNGTLWPMMAEEEMPRYEVHIRGRAAMSAKGKAKVKVETN